MQSFKTKGTKYNCRYIIKFTAALSDKVGFYRIGMWHNIGFYRIGYGAYYINQQGDFSPTTIHSGTFQSGEPHMQMGPLV